ncbi:IniB N-terminal domain-containing protein [Arthrobacter pigmenti]
MPTLTTQLLEFLMDLLGDPEATSEFLEDPERALDEAGLGDVCSADVDAIMPVILDYAPVDVESSFDREYNTGGNSGPSGGWAPDTDNWGPDGGSGDHNHDDNGGGGGGGRGHDDDDNGGGGGGGRGDHDHDHDHDRDNGGHGGGRGGDDDHGHAVQQLTHIVNNYSYTSVVDDRDTINDQSVNQNIWADGDVTQLFDNEANIASGDNSVIAGDDADVDNSTDNSTDNSRDNSTNVAVGGDADVEIGNTDNSIEDSFQDNSDNSVEIEDSFQDNSDNSVDVEADLENVGNKTDNSDNSDNSIDVDADLQNVGNTDNSDNSTNIDAELENVGNDQSTNIDAELENIGNTDNSTEVDIDDSLNGNAVGNTANLDNVGNETDNSVNTDVEVDDSLNGNAVGNTTDLQNVGNDQSTTTDVNVEDIEAEFTSVDDSVIVQDNELDVELESETTTITEDG